MFEWGPRHGPHTPNPLGARQQSWCAPRSYVAWGTFEWGPRHGPHTPNPLGARQQSWCAPRSYVAWGTFEWGPRHGPHTPNRSERASKPGALLGQCDAFTGEPERLA